MDFEELYQEVILDHSRRPRNFGELPQADVNIEADNPMCGDEIALHLKFAPDETIEAVSFTGSGCSICMASASMMTQTLKRMMLDNLGYGLALEGLAAGEHWPAPKRES